MRTASLVAAILVAASIHVAAQSSKQDDQPDPVRMNGCVGRAPTAPQQSLTFEEGDSGFRYRLTGRGLNKYAGQRVEVVGAVPRPKRFAIRGGLWPSPNVAAQAGAMDPAKAAVARQPGGPESGTGGSEMLPEFRVTRIRVVDGACE